MGGNNGVMGRIGEGKMETTVLEQFKKCKKEKINKNTTYIKVDRFLKPKVKWTKNSRISHKIWYMYIHLER